MSKLTTEERGALMMMCRESEDREAVDKTLARIDELEDTVAKADARILGLHAIVDGRNKQFERMEAEIAKLREERDHNERWARTAAAERQEEIERRKAAEAENKRLNDLVTESARLIAERDEACAELARLKAAPLVEAVRQADAKGQAIVVLRKALERCWRYEEIVDDESNLWSWSSDVAPGVRTALEVTTWCVATPPLEKPNGDV